jgi:flagellar biosynthetic protein FlhB
VGWLWSPGLVAPDPTRLWGLGAGRGLAAGAGRGAWSLARTTAVVGVAAWAVRSRLDGLANLPRSDGPALALAWSDALRGLLASLGAAALALGLVDLAMQRRRFNSMLQLTPEQAKEDRKATDGDPAVRSRRLRMARAWRGDAPELLAGASLLVVGDGGLAVILAGGPPPARVSVRSAADGPTGRALRRSAESSRLPILERPALARRLSRLATRDGGPVPPDGMAELAKAWPAG